MPDDLHEIDSLFRDLLEPLEQTPNAWVWKNLKSQLNSEDAATYKRKFLLTKKIAITLFLMLLIISFYQLFLPVINQIEVSVKNSGENKFKNKSGLESGRERHYSLNAVLSHQTCADKINTARISSLSITEYQFSKPELKNFKIMTDQNIEAWQSGSIIPGAVSEKPGNSEKISGAKFTKKFRPRWYLSAFASPIWTKYLLEDDLPDNQVGQTTGSNRSAGNMTQNTKSMIEEREKPEISFKTGIMLDYQFNKHWQMETGLIYYSTYITISPQKIYAVDNGNGNVAYKMVTSSGYGYLKPDFSSSPEPGDSLSTTTSKHNLQYLSVPVLAKYFFEKDKYMVSAGFGIAGNILTSSSIYTEVENGPQSEIVFISKLQGTKPIFLSLEANAKISYLMKPNLSLSLIPSVSYGITPVTRNNVVKTYPYHLGIGMGLTYQIK